MSQKTKFKDVKTVKVNMRISESLKDKVEYLKLLPGGITGWCEDRLREVEIDPYLLEKLTRK